MKKTAQLFFLLLFVNSFSGKAQQYVPLVVDSTHWFLETPFWGPPPYWYAEYYLLGDTVISSVSYKKVYSREELSSSGYGNMTTNFLLAALLREDTTTKKVYAIPIQNYIGNCQLNQEILLYDFNLQVGDTLKASNLCLQLNDEVVTNITQGNPWLSSKSFILNMPTELYEGVGSYYGLLETIFISVSGPQRYLIDYCRGGLTNCKYLNVGINNRNIVENISITPNPILDYFAISSKENFEFEYTVFSVDGQLVKNGTGKSNINIPVDLKQGIYILQINNEKRQIHHTKKLIKLYN